MRLRLGWVHHRLPLCPGAPQNIESELDLASASYLETDDGIRPEPAKGLVHLSTLLKWYRSDFGDDDKEVGAAQPALTGVL